MQTVAPLRGLEAESALLSILLTAETAREGGSAVLDLLMQGQDVLSSALGIRDRDSNSMYVLAERGAPRSWPAMLDPQVAVGGEPGVDRATGVMVVPLRAEGRVVGAVFMDDPHRAVRVVQDLSLKPVFETAAAVLHSLLERMESELRHRLAARRSIDAVVDGMAHQMANPLTGASALAQLLLEDLKDSAHAQSVHGINIELGRAFAVLGDLLEFHRDTHVHDGYLDLLMVTQRVLRFRGYAIREAGIDLHFEPSPESYTVHADSRLEHALLRGLHWAEERSHGRVNRTIDVRIVGMGESEAAIEITDSSSGDIPEITADYFDLPLLSRDIPAANAAVSDTPDLGLVDRLLRACGGRLTVRGSKLGGTTISLIVPVTMKARAELSPTGDQAR